MIFCFQKIGGDKCLASDLPLPALVLQASPVLLRRNPDSAPPQRLKCRLDYRERISLTCDFFAIYFPILPVPGIHSSSNARFIDDCWIGNYLAGSGRGLVEVLTRHLPVGTDRNHKHPHSEWPMSRRSFEPSTSGTRVSSVTARPFCSVIWLRYLLLTLRTG